MALAFPALVTFYRLAIGELAAIAKAAAHMELPAMGVATSLYRPGVIPALQPEVGCRGHRRGDAGHERERGSRDGQF